MGSFLLIGSFWVALTRQSHEASAWLICVFGMGTFILVDGVDHPQDLVTWGERLGNNWGALGLGKSETKDSKLSMLTCDL